MYVEVWHMWLISIFLSVSVKLRLNIVQIEKSELYGTLCCYIAIRRKIFLSVPLD